MAADIRALNRQLAILEQTPLPPADHYDARMRADPDVVLRPNDPDPHTATQWVQGAEGFLNNQMAEPASIFSFLPRLPNLFNRSARQPGEEQSQELLRLEKQEISLIYRSNVRVQVVPPGFDQLQQEFSDILERYKQNPDLYPGGPGHLTPQDQVQIDEACRRYPHFVEALIRRNRQEEGSNDPWTLEFVKFCLRSPGLSSKDARHWVDIFVQFPNEARKLMDANLDKQLGAVDPGLLGIRPQADWKGPDDEDDNTVALCMRVDGRWEKIQGPKLRELRLRNTVNDTVSYNVRLDRIYEQIKKKWSASYENIDVFQLIPSRQRENRDGEILPEEQERVEQAGIVDWDAIHFGSFNGKTNRLEEVNVSRPGWINRLPVWRVLTEAEVRERYAGQVDWHQQAAHNTKFGFAMCANRQHTDMSLLLTHGFFELIVPDPDRPGQFRIFPIGFQPEELPHDTREMVEALLTTKRAYAHYPDVGANSSNRAQWREFYSIDAHEFQTAENVLARFITKAREGREVFQILGDSCARHAQKVFDKVVGVRFYGGFSQIAQALFPGRDVHEEIKNITKRLDERALHKLSCDVAQAVVRAGNREQMAQLLRLCLTNLANVLKTNVPAEELRITEEQARERIGAALQHPNATAILERQFSDLIHLTFESMQMYKISFFKTKFHKPLIGKIFDFLCFLPNWLSWFGTGLFFLVTSILSLCVGSLRRSFVGYRYQRNDGTIRAASVWTNPLFTRARKRMTFLPAQAFNRPELKNRWHNKVLDIINNLGREPVQLELA